MDLIQNIFQFDAGQAGARTWPMPPMSQLATELLSTLLSHVAAGPEGLAQLEHAVPTFDYSAKDDDCLLCAIGEIVNTPFNVPVEGGVLPVQMVAETFLNGDRLRFLLGEDYAVFLRCVATPAPMTSTSSPAHYHRSTNMEASRHADTR